MDALVFGFPVGLHDLPDYVVAGGQVAELVISGFVGPGGVDLPTCYGDIELPVGESGTSDAIGNATKNAIERLVIKVYISQIIAAQFFNLL